MGIMDRMMHRMIISMSVQEKEEMMLKIMPLMMKDVGMVKMMPGMMKEKMPKVILRNETAKEFMPKMIATNQCQ
jgi:hypothetical protein